MVLYPVAKDDLSDEANVVYDIGGSPIGGTFTDAVKQTYLYDVVEAVEDYLGYSGQTASSTGSITQQVKYLLAQSGGITQSTTAPGAPTDGQLWLDADETPAPGVRRYELDDTTWHLIGADALKIGGRDVDTSDTPLDGQAIKWNATTSKFEYGSVTSTSPLTTPGDLYYRGATADARLGIGNEGNVLLVSGGYPAWTVNPFVPAPGSPQQGDLLYYTGSTWARLGHGTSGQFLKTLGVSADPAWSDLPAAGGAVTSPVGSTRGDILYHDATDWVRLPAGTSGQFLKTNGSGADPAWATPASGMTNPMTTAGDFIYGTSGGAPARLPIGANGQVLQITAGAPAWAANPAGFTNPMTTLGDLIVGDTGGSAIRLAKGLDTYLLAAGASTLGYINPNTVGYKIKDEGGSALTKRSYLNFIGSSIAATDNSGNDATDITVTAYNTVKDAAGSAVTQRAVLKFTGSGLSSVADTGGETVVTISGGSGGYATVQEEGSSLTARTTLNFIGSSVTAADNSGSTRTDVTVQAYNTVKDAAGSAATQRAVLKFTGAGLTSVADVGSETVVTIGGGGGWSIGGNTLTGASIFGGTSGNYPISFYTNNFERMVIFEGTASQTQIVVRGTKGRPGFIVQVTDQDNVDQSNALAWENYESSGAHRTREMQVVALSQASYAADMVIGLNQGSGQGDTSGSDQTTRIFRMKNNGHISHGASPNTDGAFLYSSASVSAGNVDHLVENTNNSNTGSNARYIAKCGGTSAGDAYISFQIPSGTSWGIGPDNSDRDILELYQSDQAPGTSPRLSIYPGGNIGVATQDPAARFEVNGGNASLGASDVATKTGSRSGRTVTLTVGTFASADVGRLIVFNDGTIDRIVAFTDSTHVEVSTSGTVSSQTLITKNVVSHTNYDWGRVGISGTANAIPATRLDVDGDLAVTAVSTSSKAYQSSTTVTAASGLTPFAATDVGKLIVWETGATSVITAFTSSSVVTVTPSATIAGSGSEVGIAIKTPQLYVPSAAGGNVGIATANPGALLHVGAGGDAPATSGTAIYATNAGGTYITARDSTNNAETYIGADSAAGYLGTATNHPIAFWTGGGTPAARMQIDAAKATVYINDTSNANMTRGLTINQGSATDELTALKNSGVAHGMTSLTETDTFAAFNIYGADGGMDFRGYAGGTTQKVGLRAAGFVNSNAGNVDTTKASSSEACVIMAAGKRNGTSVQSIADANANLFMVQTGVNAKFIVDAEGDLHVDGSTSLTAFDDYDDVALLEAFRVKTARPNYRERFSQDVDAHAQVLHAAGVLTLNDDGHHFVSLKGMFGLLIDALRQERGRANVLDARVARLEKALQAGG